MTQTAAHTVTCSVPAAVYAALEAVAAYTHRDVASVAAELLDEGARMRQVPGIVFTDSRTGRRARLEGSGLEVWEIIEGYRSVGEDWERLKASYDWLTERQLQAALAYYEAFPAEIDARIAREEDWTPATTYATYPFMDPNRA